MCSDRASVTAAFRQQYSGKLLKGVNQELGEQSGEQSPQDCHTSGQLPSEGPGVCKMEKVLLEPCEKPSVLCSGLAGRHVAVGVGYEMAAAFLLFL